MKAASSSLPSIVLVASKEAVELLATHIAAIVIAAQKDGVSAGSVYTSKAPPPGMTRKRFNDLCRQRGAQGDASIRKVGRVWVAPASVFEKPARLAPARTRAGEPWSAEAILESVGVRSTR